jgi:UDPglucose--hexose-1-phosphate uridylyltransferase
MTESTNLHERNFPHRRFNPLTGDWVLVSPHRTQGPWKGQVEKAPQTDLPEYDPSCYLCPGNSRSGGQHFCQMLKRVSQRMK